MSYAGPVSRTRTAAADPSAAATGTSTAAKRPRRPIETPAIPEEEPRWQHMSIFAVGLALGIAVGAGAALLAAPRTGEETRAMLRARGKRLRRSTSRRGRDAWDELRDELRSATDALRRRRAARAVGQDVASDLDREAALDE